MRQSPPSSGRRSVYMTTGDIRPTLESDAAKCVHEQVNRLVVLEERPMALIAHQEDEAEIRLFFCQIAKALKLPAPALIESWDNEVIVLVDKARGLIIRHAQILSPIRFLEVNDILKELPRRRPVVLCFRSRKKYKRARADYGEVFWIPFGDELVQWPKLAEREADWPGVIENIHATMLCRNRQPIPTLTADAVAEIIAPSDGDMSKMPDTVSRLIKFVQSIVELAITDECASITAKHVRQARLTLPSSTRHPSQPFVDA